MKKHLSYLTVATMALILSFSACNNKDKSVTGVWIGVSSYSILINDTITFGAIVLPTNANNQNVTWTSSDPSVATIDLDVLVTGLAEGKTLLIVTTQEGGYMDTCELTVHLNLTCNTNTPGWGESLGTVGFASSDVFTVSGNGITQTWSDAVTATACNKREEDYSGGARDSSLFNTDCRSNPGYPGDLFSWCAVLRYGGELCPGDWRVPTLEDFVNLDKALGGSGENRVEVPPTITLPEFANYINTSTNQWGGSYRSGYCNNLGVLENQDASALYWSVEEASTTGGYGLQLSRNWANTYQAEISVIYPQFLGAKGYGATLRCVK